MAESLLAHLYSRIKGSQEDVATISLQYILSQSKDLNKTFTTFCSSLISKDIESVLQYNCQVSGEENERPDMAGFDSNSVEQILFEMKFYAGLTSNQPLTYLERLEKSNGTGLVFVCPKARLTTLWSELCKICAESGKEVETINTKCVSVNGVRMAITTWNDILERLKDVADSSAPDSLSDIKQLKGFCDQMDNDAFIPFNDEDLFAVNAKKFLRLADVVEETSKLILADATINAQPAGKLKTTHLYYERMFKTEKFIILFSYDLDLWKSNESTATPFWVSICNKEGKQTEDMKLKLHKIDETKKDATVWDICYFALTPLTNATIDEVCQDMKKQILDYIELFR